MRAMETVYIVNEQSQNRLGESTKWNKTANDAKLVLSTQWHDQPDYLSDKWKWTVVKWNEGYRIQNAGSGRFLGQLMGNDNAPTVGSLSNGNHVGCAWIIEEGEGDMCHIQAWTSQYYLCEVHEGRGCNHRGDLGITLEKDRQFACWSILVPSTPQ